MMGQMPNVTGSHPVFLFMTFSYLSYYLSSLSGTAHHWRYLSNNKVKRKNKEFINV